MTTAESATANGFHTGRNSNRSDGDILFRIPIIPLITTTKSIITDAFQFLWKCNGIQAKAVIEGIVPNTGNVFTNFNRGNIVTIAEGIFTDACHAIRYSDGRKFSATPESRLSDGCYTIRNDVFCYCIPNAVCQMNGVIIIFTTFVVPNGVIKCFKNLVIAELGIVHYNNIQFLDAVATPNCTVSNGRHATGDGNIRQGLTLVERFASNTRHAIGDGNLL